jgi:hypothetical protein
MHTPTSIFTEGPVRFEEARDVEVELGLHAAVAHCLRERPQDLGAVIERVASDDDGIWASFPSGASSRSRCGPGGGFRCMHCASSSAGIETTSPSG